MVDPTILGEVDRQGSWADRAIAILERGTPISGDPNEIVQGLCNHISELHFTVLLAIKHGYPAAALTLMRPTFECLQRAIWLHDDPEAAVNYRQDKTPVISGLRPLVEAKLGSLPPAFGLFYQRMKLAHGLTHGGKEVVEAHYEDSHVANPEYQVAVARSVQWMALVAMHLRGMVILAPADQLDLGEVLQQIYDMPKPPCNHGAARR